MPRHRHPVCPTHRKVLVCPSCVAAHAATVQAGRELTEAQRTARRQNAQRARDARAQQAREKQAAADADR